MDAYLAQERGGQEPRCGISSPARRENITQFPHLGLSEDRMPQNPVVYLLNTIYGR